MKRRDFLKKLGVASIATVGIAAPSSGEEVQVRLMYTDKNENPKTDWSWRNYCETKTILCCPLCNKHIEEIQDGGLFPKGLYCPDCKKGFIQNESQKHREKVENKPGYGWLLNYKTV